MEQAQSQPQMQEQELMMEQEAQQPDLVEAVPLIWTSRGNLPMASLAYSTSWEVHPDYIKLVETYTLGEEVVRQSAHVLSRVNLEVAAQANSLN